MHLPFILVNISFLPQRWVFMFKGFQSPILRQPFFQCELVHWLLSFDLISVRGVPGRAWSSDPPMVLSLARVIHREHSFLLLTSSLSCAWSHSRKKSRKEHLRPGKEPSRPELRIFPLPTGSKKLLQSLDLEFLVFPLLKVSSSLNTTQCQKLRGGKGIGEQVSDPHVFLLYNSQSEKPVSKP